MNVYIPKALLGGLLALLAACFVMLISLFPLMVIAMCAGYDPPKWRPEDLPLVRLLVFGQFFGGMIWGWITKGWQE